LGPEAIARISPQIKVPFTVMGGINEENLELVLAKGALELVLAKGALRVAMVTAITKAPDIAAKVKSLKEKIMEFSWK